MDLFILGAGASKSYGFPTGAELKELALEELITGNSAFMSQVCRLGSYFGYEPSDVMAFRKSLAASTRNSSIDAFIESEAENDKIKTLSAIAKVVIAILIMRCEDDTKLKPDDDWYRELFDRLYEGNKIFSRFLENKVQFITFNYDRSLERYLLKEALETFTETTAKQVSQAFDSNFTVIHPHGSLGKIWTSSEDENYRAYVPTHEDEEVIKAAKTVRLITDDIHVDEEPDFLEARRLILEAPRVHFIGFGYNTDNMRRLGFYGKEVSDFKDDKIFGTVSGISDQKINSYVREFKLNRVSGRQHNAYSLVHIPQPNERAVDYMRIAPFD